MNMRLHRILLMLLPISLVWAQPPQENSAELEKRNGFKSIKLGQAVDSVTGATFKKDFIEKLRGKDEFPARLYTVKDDMYSMIGEVKVNSIELKTYKGLVYEIEVTTDKDQRLMKGMEKALGLAKYNVRTEAYHWAAKSLGLTYIGNKNTITLIYRSYPVINMMYADKGKKIERIADDF